jgi:hypothetical protein
MEFKNYQFCFEQEQKILVEAFKKKLAERAAAGLGGGVSLARI